MDNLTLGLSTTAIGMLVVFVGLIILIVCIYAMGMLTGRAAGKKKAPAEKAPEAAPAPIQEAPAAPAQEETTDDAQLIAVISAAIAAVWQGEESGFVVRRVRRIQNTPNAARVARNEQIYSRM